MNKSSVKNSRNDAFCKVKHRHLTDDFCAANPIAVISIYMTPDINRSPSISYFSYEINHFLLSIWFYEKSRVVHSTSDIFCKKAHTRYKKIHFSFFVHYYFIGACNQIWISLGNVTIKADKTHRNCFWFWVCYIHCVRGRHIQARNWRKYVSTEVVV